ncbi:MAG: sigma 54-interacting transcriptional regulator, partial [Alicyclobacillus sp.]|nr:sigma 54-interacting transcriptional regulator [Alicyclobacillus sp.]
SPQLQAKLLRVLQERTIRRVGELKDRPIDVRILATINEDPLEAIRAGRLRKDLYYRLSVVTLFLPPLRERHGDISQLVETFIAKYNRRFGLHVEHVEPRLLQAFRTYSWPGNVRELEHTIEGAMNLVQEEREIGFQHLPLHMRRRLEQALHDGGDVVEPTRGSERTELENSPETPESPEARANADPMTPYAQTAGAGWGTTRGADQTVNHVTAQTWQAQVQTMQRQVVTEALLRNRGNVSATARELGLSRQNLQYWLRKLQIDPAQYRA